MLHARARQSRAVTAAAAQAFNNHHAAVKPFITCDRSPPRSSGLHSDKSPAISCSAWRQHVQRTMRAIPLIGACHPEGASFANSDERSPCTRRHACHRAAKQGKDSPCTRQIPSSFPDRSGYRRVVDLTRASLPGPSAGWCVPRVHARARSHGQPLPRSEGRGVKGRERSLGSLEGW